MQYTQFYFFCKAGLFFRLHKKINIKYMRNLTLVIALFISTISFSQIDAEHLEIGDAAPLITGTDQFDNKINSSKILEDNKIILIFYRGNWCPHCRKHLKTLQENLKALNEKGYAVVVVTPEKVEKTKETAEKFGSTFSILHDADNTIMNNYKVAFEVNEKSVPNYFSATQKKLAEYNAENNNVLPVPATYIINKKGEIEFVHYDPNYSNRFDVTELLK
ncbi:AhpC/TSA family protein [Aureibaculum algae]|uniref:thioredoxin-dependent peroxiredoxin n=2 Tax=Aureibaculum algae TaxID=2584122 RepID=A0A5B7TWZ2_9FLAO|nr:AhpC/TSA family protein [Aureibaculum algae]